MLYNYCLFHCNVWWTKRFPNELEWHNLKSWQVCSIWHCWNLIIEYDKLQQLLVIFLNVINEFIAYLENPVFFFVFFSSSESSDDEEPAKPTKPLTFANKKEAIDAFKQLLKEKVSRDACITGIQVGACIYWIYTETATDNNGLLHLIQPYIIPDMYQYFLHLSWIRSYLFSLLVMGDNMNNSWRYSHILSLEEGLGMSGWQLRLLQTESINEG